MEMEWLLGSLTGRANRKQFATGLAVLAILGLLTVFAFRLGYGAFCKMDPGALSGQVFFVALAVAGIILSFGLFALLAKRLHDRNLAGWPVGLAVLALWLPPLFMRLQWDGAACESLTPARLGLAALCLGLPALLALVLLVLPGNSTDNRFGPVPGAAED